MRIFVGRPTIKIGSTLITVHSSSETLKIIEKTLSLLTLSYEHSDTDFVIPKYSLYLFVRPLYLFTSIKIQAPERQPQVEYILKTVTKYLRIN